MRFGGSARGFFVLRTHTSGGICAAPRHDILTVLSEFSAAAGSQGLPSSRAAAAPRRAGEGVMRHAAEYTSQAPRRLALTRAPCATYDTRRSVSQAECRRFESDRALHSTSRQTAELRGLRATAGCVHARRGIARMARLCEVMQQADGVTSQPTTQGAQHFGSHRGATGSPTEDRWARSPRLPDRRSCGMACSPVHPCR